MILVKVDYDQNLSEPNYWKIGDVDLGNFDLIVGLNATGKKADSEGFLPYWVSN